MYSTELSLLMLGLSVVSMSGTSIIFAMYLKDSSLRKKPYVQMVFFSCVADFIGAIATSFGELEDNTNICVAQGIMSNVFPLASILWTLAITYLLYSNVVLLKPFLVTPYLHLICWGFPCLVTFLIYTTNRIGLPNPEVVGWCFLANTSFSPDWSLLFWTMMSFYVWVLLSLLCMLIILAAVLMESRIIASRSHATASNAAQLAVSSIYIYPLIILFCWVLPCLMDICATFLNITYAGKEIIEKLSSLLPICQGCITAIVFTSRTKYLNRIFKNIQNSTRIRYSTIIMDSSSLRKNNNEMTWKILGSSITFRSFRINKTPVVPLPGERSIIPIAVHSKRKDRDQPQVEANTNTNNQVEPHVNQNSQVNLIISQSRNIQNSGYNFNKNIEVRAGSPIRLRNLFV
eukprot:gene13807-29361_t